MADKLNKAQLAFSKAASAVVKPAQLDTQRKRLLNRKEAAHFLNVSQSWLDKSRLSGLGPAYIQIGGTVRYSFEDLEQFLAANRKSSTSEQ